MVGQTIGKYRIVEQLGRGATGIVYKAVDETLNREVAIKILNPDLSDRDIMRRFRAEAKTLAKLNHPEIATIYELLPVETDLLMVMEFARGQTLDKLSSRLGPMPPDRAAYLIDKVLSGLEHAHRAGIVHRDMKPANVMVNETGGVKIMDFGIARVRGAENMTVDGYMMGTPAYMAPEQVLGKEVDQRTDLYSVGVMFYRLLTGALPFKADTAIGMLQHQVADPPTPLDRHRQGLPDWCERILDRALAKSPADRFQTAEEFRKALGRATVLPASIDFAMSPQQTILNTLVMSRGSVASAAKTATGVLREKQALAASIVAALAIAGAVLAYVTMRPAAEATTTAPPPKTAASRSAPRSAPRPSTRAFPTVTFETKTLAAGNRERDARLVLADGKITVLAADDVRYPLHSVRYESVISISYSRGPHPLWNSPTGPAPVARGGGALGRFGIFMERHWVSLRIADHWFVVLRFSDDVVTKAMTALAARTGRTPQFVVDGKGSK